MYRIALLGRIKLDRAKLFNLFVGAKDTLFENKNGNMCCYFFEGDLKYSIVNFSNYTTFVKNDCLKGSKSKFNVAFDKYDLILNVVNAKYLQKELYFSLQLMEQVNVPVLILISNLNNSEYNLMDLEKISNVMSCKVLPFDFSLAHFFKLRNVIIDNILNSKIITRSFSYFDFDFFSLIKKVLKSFNFDLILSDGMLLRLLENNLLFKKFLLDRNVNYFLINKIFINIIGEQLDVYIARCRHNYLSCLFKVACGKKNISSTSVFLDKIFLNRFLGLPLFFLIIYMMFIFSINVGSFIKDFFDFFGQAFLVDGSREFLTYFYMPSWLITLVSDGFLAGLNMVLSFSPILMCMFLFLSFLEYSGYIPRAAFVIDKLMRIIGLPGRAFVPMIIGFGCNVPAILSTRNFDNKGEKILTIIMTPFISCNARLAIYTVFVSIFYGNGGGNVIFFLYLIGIFIAIFTGLIIKNFFLKEESKLIIEFPAYKIPSMFVLLKFSIYSLNNFISKTGKMIIPISVFISLCTVLNKNFDVFESTVVSKKVIFLFKPLGIKEDNCQAVLALCSGIIAKEVIIGTLDALYRSELIKDIKDNDCTSNLFFVNKLIGEASYKISFLKTLFNHYNSLINSNYMDKDVSKIMYKKFGGPIEAFAYLLFVLLYFPCLPVIAVISKELSKLWAVFSIVWCTFVSYSVSMIFYQVMTINEHFNFSIMCLSIIFIFFIFLYIFFYKFFKI